MTIMVVDDLGAIGVLADVQAHRIPPNAWSDAINMRFEHGEAKRVPGYSQIATVDGQGMWAIPFQTATQIYWIIPSKAAIYVWDGSAVTDITRTAGSYAGTLLNLWNGGLFAGVAVLNNGIDVPQYWVDTLSNADALPNWDTEWRANVVRVFGNQLIAMGMTERGTYYPTKYRWSDIAEPGSLPDWDVLPTNQAGSDFLEETPGAIVDAEPLRDLLMVYKEDASFLLQYVGGQFVVANRMILKTRGALTQRCAKEFYGKHFVASDGDIFVHDGQQAISVCDGSVRRKIFDDMDSDTYTLSYVAPHYSRAEMWFCYPSTGNYWPNKAAVWNFIDSTWSFRDLPNASHIAFGVLPTNVQPVIDDLTEVIDSYTYSFDQRTYNPSDRQLVMVQPNTDALYPAISLFPADDLYPSDGTTLFNLLENTWEYNGAAVNAKLIRRGIKLEKGDGVFMMRALYPRGQGGALSIRVGTQDSPDSTVIWKTPVSFTPGGSQDKVNVRATSRYFALEVTFPTSEPGMLYGLDIDYVRVGSR